MKKTIIVIARILKGLAIILLITMLVTKLILKILIVKIRSDNGIANKADINTVANG